MSNHAFIFKEWEKRAPYYVLMKWDPVKLEAAEKTWTNVRRKNDHSNASNDNKIHSEAQEPEKVDSNLFTEASKMPLKPLSESQQYNISSNQDKGLNGSNFITLGKISEEEKIEIIQLGFQLQADGKISLKKYYESTNPNSLFQLKGYNIKYEVIRKDKLFRKLKPSNN